MKKKIKTRDDIIEELEYDLNDANETIDELDYYADIVFYNKFPKSYALIDLRMNKLKEEKLGWINMYLNYYEKCVNSNNKVH